MELTPRKQAVLKAIVKAYIEKGEPIGSKNLTGLLENAPSSATLRNEMSELSELGFLQQPHTSAGRIPTSNGYRLYVNSLMPRCEISDSARKMIDDSLTSAHCEPEQIPVRAAQTLSRLYGLPAISCMIADAVPCIKRLELLPIGRFTVMLLAVTDDGRTRSRIFRQGTDFTRDIKRLFDEICENHLKNRRVDELNPAFVQSVAAGAGLNALELIPLLTAACDLVRDIGTKDVTLENESALYNICGDEKTAERVKSLLKNRDSIISILEGMGDGVGAVFGTDTGYLELEQDTIIAARFHGAGKYRGTIGIIGPNRMSYDRIMPGVEYTANKLTEIMSQAQKDMEE